MPAEKHQATKKTLEQVFSCEISKNTFFQKTPLDDCFRLELILKGNYLKGKAVLIQFKNSDKIPFSFD